jgi:hypothetical protein
MSKNMMGGKLDDSSKISSKKTIRQRNEDINISTLSGMVSMNEKLYKK